MLNLPTTRLNALGEGDYQIFAQISKKAEKKIIGQWRLPTYSSQYLIIAGIVP
jgi:hypothetical protein